MSSQIASPAIKTRYEEWQENKARFHLMLDELMTQYDGQFVALHEGQIVAHGLNKDEVYRTALERAGEPTPFYFGLVSRDPRVVRMPGVWAGKRN